MNFIHTNTQLIKLLGFTKAYILQTIFNLSEINDKSIVVNTSPSHIYKIDEIIPRSTISKIFKQFLEQKILFTVDKSCKDKNKYTVSIPNFLKVMHMCAKCTLRCHEVCKMHTLSVQNAHLVVTKCAKCTLAIDEVCKMHTCEKIIRYFAFYDKKQTNQEVKEIKQEKIDENRILEQAQTKQEIKKENVEKSQDTITSKKNGSVKSFDAFWGQYPTKVDKKQTKLYWEKNKEQLNPLLETILKDIDKRIKYHARWQNKEYIRSPFRYLKNEMWNDEIIKSGMSPQLPPKPKIINPMDVFKYNDKTRSDILNTIKANENLLKLAKNGQCDNLNVQLNSAKNNLKGWNQAWNVHQEKHSQQKTLSHQKQ